MTSDLDSLLGLPPQVSERDRILGIPRDDRDPESELLELVAEWTGRVRRPGGDWQLKPVQALALAVIASERGMFGAIGVGRGKAQPVDELVCTPQGFRPIGDLRPGDTVSGRSGAPTQVTGVFPQGRKLIFDVVFSDGVSVRACGEHLWAVRMSSAKSRGHAYKIRSTMEIILDLRLKNGSPKWYVPICRAVEFPEADLPVDPWVLGVLLGDGSISSGSVAVCNSEKPIQEMLRARLPAAIQMKPNGAISFYLTTPRGKPNPLLEAIKALRLRGCRSHEKFIPESYIQASKEQRLLLLQGLLDTDGTPSNSKASFSSTSQKMAEQVAHLARSLGGIASISPRQTSYIYKGEKKLGRPSWRVFLKLPSEAPYFLASEQKKVRRKQPSKYAEPVRSIVEIRPIGEAEAVCISVAAQDSLYLTKDFIVTHNTLIALLACQAAGIKPKRTLLIIPANLRKTLGKEARRYWPHFRFDSITIASYAELSDPDYGPGFFERHKPDLIIADEAHKFKTMGTGRSSRLLYWLTPRPEVIFVPMSGSFTRTSISEYTHIIELALRHRAPVPQTWSTLDTWSACIDVLSPRRLPKPWDFTDIKPLVEAFGDEALPKNGTIKEKMKVTRAAFKSRMMSTPGVVQTTSNSVQIALILDPIEEAPPAIITDAIERARKEMRLPNGSEIDDPLRLAERYRQLAMGFYYQWQWPGGKVDKPWLEARRNLGREIARATKGGVPGLDTRGTIIRALEAGEYHDVDLADALATWRMHEHKPEPPSIPIWFSDWTLETTARLAKGEKGGRPPALVWYYWKAVADRLGRYMQVIRPGHDPPERSSKPCAVSLRSHVEGQNLRYGWSRNVFPFPMSAGDLWQQALGRTHRDPQAADEVWAHIFANTKPAIAALKKARISAEYIESQSEPQKFLLATWTSDRYPV